MKLKDIFWDVRPLPGCAPEWAYDDYCETVSDMFFSLGLLDIEVTQENRFELSNMVWTAFEFYFEGMKKSGLSLAAMHYVKCKGNCSHCYQMKFFLYIALQIISDLEDDWEELLDYYDD